jgi:hypothetical protein
MSRAFHARFVMGTVALFAALATGAGCRTDMSKPAASETLAGTVRLDGILVNYGSVTFHPEEGRPLKAIIQTDGTYRLRKPPVGEVKVVVQTGPAPKGMVAPGGPGGKSSVIETINIPTKYTSAATTDLRYKVTPDESEYNIDLKSTPDHGKP